MLPIRYINIQDLSTLYFSGCSGCTYSCCDGSRFAFLPLILEDFEEVYPYFPIVFAVIERDLRALILLSDSTGKCHYFNGQSCVLYDKRPPGCRLYPLTPFYDQILIDSSCPALTHEPSTPLVSSGTIHADFYHHRLEGFEMKRQATAAYLSKLQTDLNSLGEFRGIELFRYTGDIDDPYIQMHRKSLELFKTFQL